MRRAALTGLAAPAILALVFAALTLTQRSFLRSLGWSPVRRTEVEWPSVLSLGPKGWIEQLAFVMAALLGLVFVVALLKDVPTRSAKVGACLLGAMALALPFMAFKPDLPGRSGTSWHDAIHNGVYPVIPSCALAGSVFLAIGLRRADHRRIEAFSSAALAVVGTLALALTAVDSIAQLARYLFFGSLLAWFASLAAATWARSSGDSQCSTS